MAFTQVRLGGSFTTAILDAQTGSTVDLIQRAVCYTFKNTESSAPSENLKGPFFLVMDGHWEQFTWVLEILAVYHPAQHEC